MRRLSISENSSVDDARSYLTFTLVRIGSVMASPRSACPAPCASAAKSLSAALSLDNQHRSRSEGRDSKPDRLMPLGYEHIQKVKFFEDPK